MFALVDQALTLLEQVLKQLDPESLEPSASARLFERFSKIEKLGAAGKAHCANRYANSTVWWESGMRSPAHYVAYVSGTTVGRACDVLFTAEALKQLPSTDAAFRAGQLSEQQALEIATTASLDPDSEQSLLDLVELQELQELRRQGARLRAQARSEQERERYLYRRRRLNSWTDTEGAFRLSGWFTPGSGALIMAAIEPFRQRATLRSNHKESEATRLADALVAMAEHSRHVPEDALRPGPGAMIHVRVDRSALLRGKAEKGETCEVPGVGPIPVATAQALLSDAVISAIVTEGEQIHSVHRLGRTIPGKLRTAVIARDPQCVVPGCPIEHHLEIDHIIPVIRGGGTYLNNLARLCHYHHYLKTHHGYQLKRLKGRWLWHGPNGPPPEAGAAQRELETVG